ncbi:MAG TPA: hypothetical protein VLL76_03945, partial [Candidatus Omnitrophota bacterium]|nr:hypothetical protein [Candidatus Omnitrophota bacterium]
MNGLTVKSRIYGGFFILLAFLAFVSGFAVLQFKGVGQDVAGYGSAVTDTVNVLKIDRAVTDMRRMVLGFIDKGDPKTADAIRSTIATLRKDLQAAAAINPEIENRTALEDMVRVLDQYAVVFDKAAELRIKRDKIIVDELAPMGNQAVQHLEGLAQASSDEKDWETGTYAGRAMQELLNARLNVLRYLTYPDQKTADFINDRFTGLSKVLAKLAETEKDPAHRRAIQAAADLVPPYQKGFAGLVANMNELDRLVTKDLPELGLSFAEIAGKVRDAELTGMAETQQSVSSDISATTSLTIVLALVALGLGLAFAYLIARSIINPITGMTHAMTDLAGGQLDVAVPAL